MNIALIFAGGSGTRMNTKSRPKQFLEMNGKPIIIHTIEYFENCKDIDKIVVVCIEDWIERFGKMLTKYNITKVERVVPGGATGQLSIYNGLCAAREVAGDKLSESVVLIHDGVRPLITEQLILDNIAMVKEKGSAITVTPATETIIQVNENNEISNVVDRNSCYTAKAPQSFFLKDILAVHEKALSEGKDNMIDSATMMRTYGHVLHTVVGPVENIKITNPTDFYIFRSIYEARENSQIFGL
ncbi:MAG: 2-C-methyl-D-erythritol 4-phosphate cytidylyltransferase [Lachnospiraceae bacterium]|nr:2-C-methyl-D-erythritol 4-phosphate cytidylyltransferase [Lachnospiraceae bacterium]